MPSAQSVSVCAVSLLLVKQALVIANHHHSPKRRFKRLPRQSFTQACLLPHGVHAVSIQTFQPNGTTEHTHVYIWMGQLCLMAGWLEGGNIFENRRNPKAMLAISETLAWSMARAGPLHRRIPSINSCATERGNQRDEISFHTPLTQTPRGLPLPWPCVALRAEGSTLSISPPTTAWVFKTQANAVPQPVENRPPDSHCLSKLP